MCVKRPKSGGLPTGSSYAKTQGNARSAAMVSGSKDPNCAFTSASVYLNTRSRAKVMGLPFHACSSDEHAWNGSPITFARDRVFKYTDADVKAQFGSFEPDNIAALLALPCVFAYEEPVGKPPLFGRLTHILPAGQGVKLDYEIVPVD